MTLQDFSDLLTEVGIPYFYRTAKKNTALPWITYNSVLEPLLIADNYVYSAKRSFNIELYTQNKTEAEYYTAKLIELFNARELVWDISESISQENEYLITYISAED